MERDQTFEGELLLLHLAELLRRSPAEFSDEHEEGEEFEAAEHENIGNNVILRFPGLKAKDPREEFPAINLPLKLPNGVKLTFGQIVALAGDFYGVPEEPIVSLGSSGSKRERFLAAYGTLGSADSAAVKDELKQLLKIMKEEKQALAVALESNESSVAVNDDSGNIHIIPKDVYDKLGNSLAKKYDQALDGTWIGGVPVISGRMMSLAKNNFDHFMPYAKEAYETGHELALEKAREANAAKQEKQRELLEAAYTIDAFACHFLTDSFSSGHIRTPRRELQAQITPQFVGDLLCKYMHDEDSKYGLRVTNKRGDQWTAFGDGMLFNKENECNRKLSVDAVQTSVNQIYEAFLTPGKEINTNSVTDFIPLVDSSQQNNYPMFQIKDGSLMRRADIDNLSDAAVTSFYGSTTLLKVRSYQPRGSVTDTYNATSSCLGCSQSLDPIPKN